jgi:3-methyladenine DNA glycosylase AlkD
MLYDKEDLIHKANGWALRFAGDKDRKRLTQFLDKKLSQKVFWASLRNQSIAQASCRRAR